MTAPLGGGADGVQQDRDDLGPIEDNPIWRQDHVALVSVGIDVGSSGTQVVFSRLHLRRSGEDLTSRYIVTRRDMLYRSPVALTPYAGDERIDAGALGAIVDRAYAAARVHPDAVDTGVVILTGEALRRRNAESITRILAERGGELVCASAGHNMEALLAAYGSGAARASYDRRMRVLNLDVGGGTTKLALLEDGRATATAAVDIGGRVVVVDDDGRIRRLTGAGRQHARRAGLEWDLGTTVGRQDLEQVAETMADSLVAAVTARPLPEAVARLHLTPPIDDLRDVDGVMFSGGVGEYVYARETRDFHDLGRHLGAALRRRVSRLPGALLPPGECIRATALGASQYTVQLSGNTGSISDPAALLPRRNLQVLRPRYALGDTVEPEAVAAAIRRHLAYFNADRHDRDLALALHWSGVPSHDRLAAFAAGVVAGLATRIARGQALYLVLDGDVALTLGRILRDELGVDNDLVVIDGLSLWDFDYIDVGRLRHPSGTVPVTIKSLVFGHEGGHRGDASPGNEATTVSSSGSGARRRR